MLGIQSEPPGSKRATSELLPLENGDRLHSREFLRRYEAMPEVKKAELIKGVVYMGSPVRADVHAEPDALVQTWLGVYVAHTPGTKAYSNATLLLDSDNTFQPDAMLCLTPERGGRTRLNEKGYLCGPPELLVEVAASSASIDLSDKFDVYRRVGVSEYVVWRTAERALDWFRLEGDEYQALQADSSGHLHSRTFPGLVLAVEALLALDGSQVLSELNQGLVSAAHRKFINKSEVQ